MAQQKHNYISIKDYLSTPQGNIKSIKFYDDEGSELEINQNYISVMTRALTAWSRGTIATSVYADRDNKTIHIIDKEHDEHILTFPYTTNETVFETST